jgi:hypothetical protein
MFKRPQTRFHGIDRDSNAERVVLYTLLGSICLFLPAVRVIADTTFERHIATDSVVVAPMDHPQAAAPPHDPALHADVEPERPIVDPQP